MRLRGIVCASLAVFAMATSARGADPAVSCQSSKIKTAGKYGFCRLKEEAKAAKTSTTPDFSKCDQKFSLKWSLAETKGAGMCPSSGDEASLKAFIAKHSEDVAAALAGGPLPDCSGDLTTCNDNLESCNSSYAECNDLLITCQDDRDALQTDAATVSAGTAVQGDVLTGKTFSSGAGLGLAGSMPDNGAVTLTPGTANQTIAAGYHSGGGFCAGDADLVAANVVSGVNLFSVTGTALPAQPLKTAQTVCTNAGGGVAACAGTGQDGELQKGVTRAYVDNGDGTITDTKTGLMWEKLSDDGSIHDKDTTYLWINAFVTKVATLNSGSFAGYTDWRVPNINELQSLLNYGTLPAIHPVFNSGCIAGCTVTTCSCVFLSLDSRHWSSTTSNFNNGSAYDVNFFDASSTGEAKASAFHVRAVRGGS